MARGGDRAQALGPGQVPVAPLVRGTAGGGTGTGAGGGGSGSGSGGSGGSGGAGIGGWRLSRYAASRTGRERNRLPTAQNRHGSSTALVIPIRLSTDT